MRPLDAPVDDGAGPSTADERAEAEHNRDEATDRRGEAADLRDQASTARDVAEGRRDDATRVRVEAERRRDHARDRRDRAGDERDEAAGRRDQVAGERDRVAGQRDEAGDRRDEVGDRRDRIAAMRDEEADRRDEAAARRDAVADGRDQRADRRDQAAAQRDDEAEERDRAAEERDRAAAQRDEAARRRDEVDEQREMAARNGADSPVDLRAPEARRVAAADRQRALQDRQTGAGARDEARQDRAMASADRRAGALERAEARQDRGTAMADRRASAGERGEAVLDRSAAAYDTWNIADLARDNGLLYARERSFSEALQYSLLTAPPPIDGLEIAVRYLPATEAFKVGGDWYDAFVTASGSTVLVVGDVVGHDIAAAVTMGQLRTLLRGIAFTTGDWPAAVLGRLEAGVKGLAPGTLATAIVARIEHHGGGDRPASSYLRWSNAGHPPPVLLLPDGHVRILGDGDGDLLLGVDPGARRCDQIVPLPEGCTVLLYSDGLVERRASGLSAGIERLGSVVKDLRDLPLEDFCDEVLSRMLAAEHEDDVALLALRIEP